MGKPDYKTKCVIHIFVKRKSVYVYKYMYFIEKRLKKIVVKMFLAMGIMQKKYSFVFLHFCNEHNCFYKLYWYIIYDYIVTISSIKKILANNKNNNSYKY